jgi:hypothetical protein
MARKEAFMPPDRHQRLSEAIRNFDARLRVLSDLGIDLSRPGRELLAGLRARRDELRRQREERERVQREADRLLLPELLDLYRSGSDEDREFIRDLLDRCPSFRWGFGWGLDDRIATEEDARRALAVLSMKDGGSDYRDQIVALDHLSATMRRLGLPGAALLAETAALSSDVTRFPPARSTRGLLLDRAGRFAD